MHAALFTVEQHGPGHGGPARVARAGHEADDDPHDRRPRRAGPDRPDAGPARRPGHVAADHARGPKLLQRTRRRSDEYLATRVRALPERDRETLARARRDHRRARGAAGVSPRLTAAWRRTFSSARRSRNFRLFLTGQMISATGTWMNFTASSWLVLQLSGGSGTALGAERRADVRPDAVHRRRSAACSRTGTTSGGSSMVTQSAYALVAVAMGTIVATDVATLGLVYTLSVVAGDRRRRSTTRRGRASTWRWSARSRSRTPSASTAPRSCSAACSARPSPGVLIASVGLAVCYGVDALELRRGAHRAVPDATRRAPRAAAVDAREGPPAGRAPLRLADRRPAPAADADGRDLHVLLPVAGAGAAALRARVPGRAGGVRRALGRRRASARSSARSRWRTAARGRACGCSRCARAASGCR